MPVAVPIVAGTAIRGVAATLMMRGVLARHPNAFLITLANLGLTIPLHRSQEYLADDIRKGLLARGRDPESPIVLVGHSQGALASLRYGINHRDQVKHVVSVGAPWKGSTSARRVSGWVRRTGIDVAPALADMAEGSPFLQSLHEDLHEIADRVTNIYSTHEMFILPYTHAHIDVPGVKNIIIATHKEYRRHLMTYPDLLVDERIEGRTTHLGEMSMAEVRSVIWATVEEVSAGLS